MHYLMKSRQGICEDFDHGAKIDDPELSANVAARCAWWLRFAVPLGQEKAAALLTRRQPVWSWRAARCDAKV